MDFSEKYVVGNLTDEKVVEKIVKKCIKVGRTDGMAWFDEGRYACKSEMILFWVCFYKNIEKADRETENHHHHHHRR